MSQRKRGDTRVALEMDVPDGSPRPEDLRGQSWPASSTPTPHNSPTCQPVYCQLWPISRASSAFRQLPTQWAGTGAGGLGSWDSVLSGGNDGAVHTQRPTVRGLVDRNMVPGAALGPSQVRTQVSTTCQSQPKSPTWDLLTAPNPVSTSPTNNTAVSVLSGPSFRKGASLSVIWTVRTFDGAKMGGQGLHG